MTIRQIIFIPGIMGSVLKEKKSKLWPNLNITNAKRYEKLLDLENEDIYASNVEPISYKKLVEYLEEASDEFLEYPYDWRKNNLDHLEKLYSELSDTADEIIIIAHSMGGLLSKLLINKYSDGNEGSKIEKIKKLITLGTPWHGSLDSYKALKYGKRVPKENFPLALTNSEAIKITPAFPSVYQLLPHAKYYELSTDSNGNNYHCFEKLEKKYVDGESFFIDIIKEKFDDNKHEYTRVFEEFYELLLSSLPENIEHFEIIGVGHPTISSISENNLNEASAHRYDGDGTVPIFSAMTNGAFNFFVNKAEHGKLAKIPEVKELISVILDGDFREYEDNRKIFTSLESEFYEKFYGKIIKIACPVDIAIVNEADEAIYGSLDTIDEDFFIDSSKSEFMRFENLGTTKYIIIDETTDLELSELDRNVNKIRIQATDTGPTSVSIDAYSEGNPMSKRAFETFEISIEKEAEINLAGQLDDNNLLLHSFEGESVLMHAETVSMESEVILPSSIISLENDDLVKTDDNLTIVNSDLEVKIEETQRGTFEVDAVFIKIGEDISILNKIGTTNIKINEGYNEIEYFSKDIADNFEVIKKINVFKLPEVLFHLELKFLPHFYLIELQWNRHYEGMIEKYNLNSRSLRWTIKKYGEELEVSHLNNMIPYKSEVKEISISFSDVFGKQHEVEYIVDENILTSIFEGTAEPQNLSDLLSNLNLEGSKVTFTINDSNKFSKISKDNILKCTQIKAEKNELTMVLKKVSKYDLYWKNLSEEIYLDNIDELIMSFTLLNKDQREVKTIKLGYFLSFNTENHGVEYSSKEEVNYDETEGSYKFSINLDLIRIKRNIIEAFEVTIYDLETENSIRTQEILLRK